MPEITFDWANNMAGLDRSDVGKVVSFLTGHGLLMSSRARFDRATDPACRLCGSEDETAHHLLHECGDLVEERSRLTNCNPQARTRAVINFARESMDRLLNVSQMGALGATAGPSD